MSENTASLLQQLRGLLENLPSELPLGTTENSKYACFLSFGLDAELMDKIEDEVGVFNEQFKEVFGWRTRTTGDGILSIEERGEPICAVVNVLSDFLSRYPSNGVLKKWATDILVGAKKAYQIHGKSIPSYAANSDNEEEIIELHDIGNAPSGATKKRKSESLHVSAIGRGRGRPPNALIAKLVIKSETSAGKPKWQCIGRSDQPCPHIRMGNAAEDRVLKHASSCSILDPDLKKLAIEASSESSLGHAITTDASKGSADSEQVSKKPRVDPGSAAADDQKTGSKRIDMYSWARSAGKKLDEDAKRLFQQKVDHVILRLICVCGLVPHIIDSPEWKELMALLNPRYSPTSSSAFEDKYIPKEANYVRQQQIQILQGLDNLTLTFDGNGTRRDAIYFAHVTTPDRNSYFVEGHEGSDERHTTAWVKDKVVKTINQIGRERMAAVCSDSTAVTKGARRETVKEIPTMLDLCDVCHHIHNTIGNITSLPAFKPMTKSLKAIVAYFGRSVHARTALRKALTGTDGNEKVRALQKIGKTRFGTYWTAAVSLAQCLPTIRDLVVQGEVKFRKKSVQELFKNRWSNGYQNLERALTQYIAIVEPFIRSLWALESSTANAADVYVFWLAIAAHIQELFKRGQSETGIAPSLAEEIIAIFNDRFDEFFANDIYFTAFTLDPRYPRSDFFLIVETAEPSIVLPGPNANLDMPNPRAFYRMKEFLKSMLRSQIDHMKKHPNDAVHPVLQEIGAKAAANELKEQVEAFWKREYPFQKPVRNGDTLGWWQALVDHPQARVLAMLAVKIFSILVNSMPDERTGSNFTWLNSALRGNQLAQTLIDMVQIGQWYRNLRTESQNIKPPSRKRPTVKFRDMEKDILRLARTTGSARKDPRTGDGDDRDAAAAEADPEDDEDDEEDAEDSPAPVTASELQLGDTHIDLNAPALKDMLSAVPVPGAPSSTESTNSTPASVSPGNENLNSNSDSEIDWDEM